MRITTKKQMYQLLNNGKLGNTFRSWDSWEEVLESGYRGLMSVRSLKIGDPVRIYDIPFEEVEKFAPTHPHSLIFYEATPHKTRLFQGEVCVFNECLQLTYTFVKLPMRLAFNESELHAEGLLASSLMRTYVDPSSLDDIYELLKIYRGHVIEFSTFRVNVGILQKPTVIWEVRDY